MKYSLVSPGSGLSPSWYLQHVIVRDLQSSKSYFFLVNDWLSVESEDNDGLVEREVFAASECSTSSGSFSLLAPGPSFSPGITTYLPCPSYKSLVVAAATMYFYFFKYV